jgi:hypothetical protein
MITILLMAEIRRSMVLNQTKCQSNDAWGSGAIIFSPIKNNTMEGLNHRLLPMLELTIISVGNLTKIYNKNNDDINFKSMINTKIMNTIMNWNEVIIHDKATIKRETTYFSLIKFLISISNTSGDKEVMLSTDDIKIGLNCQIKSYELCIMLNELHTAGLLEYKKNGKKRLRNWIVSKAFLFV